MQIEQEQRKDEVKISVDRRIAMGRGKNGFYHFDFLDVDNPPVIIQEMIENKAQLLTYRTRHGYHIVSPSHYSSRSVALNEYRNAKWVDPKCPHNAIRIYPNDDYRLINYPENIISWCPRVFGIYSMIFPEIARTLVKLDVNPCPPLHFGIYTVTKDNKKLHGVERVNEIVT